MTALTYRTLGFNNLRVSHTILVTAKGYVGVIIEVIKENGSVQLRTSEKETKWASVRDCREATMHEREKFIRENPAVEVRP